jgi:hypothetical protein
MIEDRRSDREPASKTSAQEALESSIISAHMRYFKGNSDTNLRKERVDNVLYNAVISYFAADPDR